MTINVTLLDQTLAHIEAHPGEWNQDFWRCGTGMCFAGWACQLAGGQWAHLDPDNEDLADYLHAEPGDEALPNELITAQERATRILGLTNHQAATLFAGSNTLGDLRRIVAEIKNKAAAEAKKADAR